MTTGDATERLRGIVLMILGASSFAVVDGVSKILAETQSVGQIVWARYALAVPVLLGLTPLAEWRGLLRTKRPFLQAARGAMPLVISATMVLAVRHLPLADATVILFAGPFLIVVLSQPLLGERVSAASWVAVAVGFAAVLMVAKPGFGELSGFAIYPLIAAVVFSLYQVATRRLGATGEKPNTTLAWTLLMGSLVATPVAAFTWVPVAPVTWALMAALGIAFGFAQGLLIRAYVHAPAELLAPFSYAQVIAATIFGIAVFGAVPDGWTLLGIVLIVAAGIYVVRRRRRA